MAKEDPEWGGFLQATFLAVLESADEGLVVFDGDGRCRMIGRRAGEIFGLEPAAYVGRLRDEVLAAFAQACEEPDVLLEIVAPNAALPAPASVVEVDVRRPRPRTVLCKGVRVHRAGRPSGWLILFTDVTRERAAERQGKQLQARIVELTAYDALTGLLNLRRFREELEREHGRSTRAWDSYAILRLDVDGMGAINDEFGRPVGDQILERIAGAPQELPARIRRPRPPRGRRVRRAPARRRRARGPGRRQADVPYPRGRRALSRRAHAGSPSRWGARFGSRPPASRRLTSCSARARPSSRRNRGA